MLSCLEKVKMFQFFIMVCISITLSAAKAPQKQLEPKAEVIDELKAPNVLKTKRNFIFKETIISLLNNKNIAFIIFDLTINRDSIDPTQSHEDDLPLIIDTLISDLFPCVNLFISDVDTVSKSSFEQRVTRVLKAKFKWITDVKISNLRIQGTKQ